MVVVTYSKLLVDRVEHYMAKGKAKFMYSCSSGTGPKIQAIRSTLIKRVRINAYAEDVGCRFIYDEKE